MDFAPHEDLAPSRRVSVEYPAPSADKPAGGEVRALDNLHQFGDGGLRFVDQRQQRVAYLIEIVRRDAGGHSYRDALGAVYQERWELGREDRRFIAGVVVVALHVHGVEIEVMQHFGGGRRHSGFGISHCRGGVAVYRAEVALRIDQRIPQRPVLPHSHQRRIDYALTVRMVVARGVAGYFGAFAVLGTGSEVKIIHRHQDAPLAGLEPVAYVRKGAVHDSAHGVGQI